MFNNSQQRMMNTIHRIPSRGESWKSLYQVSDSARRLALDTNAKTIGLLLLLCMGILGSPTLAQTPSALPDTANGIVDSRKQSSELLRRARVAMQRNNLDLAERYVLQAEKLGAPKAGVLSRFADTPEKVRKDLAKLRSTQAAQPDKQENPSATPSPGVVPAKRCSGWGGAAGRCTEGHSGAKHHGSGQSGIRP